MLFRSIVGSDSLRNEVELIFIIDEVLDALNIPGFTIKLNNRKILAGIAEVAGIKNQLIAFTVALDKLDKIGQEGVEKELLERGISAEVITQIQPLFLLTGDFSQRLAVLADFLRGSDIGTKGIQELTFINEKVSKIGLKKGLLELDVTLARGLNYYTGAIIEVKAHEVSMGSICGGGRYDNLTELFGLSGVSGVGISFGADRIYDIMESLSLFPNQLSSAPDILFLNFSEEEADQCALWANELRSLGKLVELYPSNAKLQKQMKYANDKGINWVVFYGDQERKEGKVVVKNMLTGDQTTYQASSWLSAWLG